MSSIDARNAAVVTVLFLALLCTGALAQAAAPGAAQAYPVKPIRLIVPFPAGASSDIVGRMLAQKLSEQLGEQVVTDNRAGAGGKSGDRGRGQGSARWLHDRARHGEHRRQPFALFEPRLRRGQDLAPVARLTSIPNILLVHPSVPAKTLRQFINLARAHPGKLNFGSGGAGTTNHLANELLKHLEKINIVHVPYKGVTQAMVAMMGGEVDEVVMPVASALVQIRAGKVRALAVLTEQRIATLPDVPTGIEAGVPDFTMPVWYGMFAPAATPRDIVSRLSRELVKALEAPDLRERLTALGVDPWPGTPEQLGELLRADIERFRVIVRSAGLPRE